MALTDGQLKKICLLGQGADQCRYLAFDDDAGCHICYKQVEAKRRAIDKHCQKFIADAARMGMRPEQMGRPLANNCQGYPPFRTVPQGYDAGK